MNCNCVKSMETKLAAAPFIVEKAGDNITATCQAVGFAMSEEMDLHSVINIPFVVRGTGKGYNTVKGKAMPFVSSFCPFCGRIAGHGKYTVGADAGIAAAFAAGAA
jgi:hypothetical protein